MGGWKNLFAKGEKGLAKSLLKWKLEKEGKSMEGKEEDLEQAAQRLVAESHTIVKKHGRNILHEIKEASKELKKTRRD